MKHTQKITLSLVSLSVAGSLLSLTACGASGIRSDMSNYDIAPSYNIVCEKTGVESLDQEDAGYRYDSVIEQGFVDTAKQSSAYFTLDRNTTSYSYARALIDLDCLPSGDSVRIEELLNYFTYDYPAPAQGEVMKATSYLSPCPWNEDHQLLTVGIKTEERVISTGRNNYVFLVDVSGSMGGTVSGYEGMTRIELVKYSIYQALEGLGDNDSVSVVTYASGVEVKLAPTFATKAGKKTITDTVKKLNAYGSTNGSGGLDLAYEQAKQNFSDNGNNRVILMSDGDFNVGIYDQTELTEFIQTKAQSGIYLSVLGYGLGDTRDDFMQTLALNGNGNYAYIDTQTEAQKVLKDELNGTLTTVAKDVKAGIAFDPSTVTSYRTIGYDRKTITEDEFNNTEKDAGEIGSNLCVTVMYEIALAKDCQDGATLADVTIRFKDVAQNEENKELTVSVVNTYNETDDVRFAACVAEYGLLLRRSQYMGSASYTAVTARLTELGTAVTNDVYRDEFTSLVKKAYKLSVKEA